MEGQSGADNGGAVNAQDKNESNKRYITGGRKRSENNVSRDFSNRNDGSMPAFFAAAMANDTPVRQVDRSRMWRIVGIGTAIVVLVGIIIFAIINIFRERVGGTVSEEAFRGMIDYHDEMNCETTYYYQGEERKFSIAANDGWKNVVIKGVPVDNVVVDLTVYNDDIYIWRYDAYDSNNRKMNHVDSIILTKEYFEHYYNYDLENNLRVLGASNDERAIKCKTLDASVLKKPDEKLFVDHRSTIERQE